MAKAPKKLQYFLWSGSLKTWKELRSETWRIFNKPGIFLAAKKHLLKMGGKMPEWLQSKLVSYLKNTHEWTFILLLFYLLFFLLFISLWGHFKGRFLQSDSETHFRGLSLANVRLRCGHTWTLMGMCFYAFHMTCQAFNNSLHSRFRSATTDFKESYLSTSTSSHLSIVTQNQFHPKKQTKNSHYFNQESLIVLLSLAFATGTSWKYLIQTRHFFCNHSIKRASLGLTPYILELWIVRPLHNYWIKFKNVVV